MGIVLSHFIKISRGTDGIHVRESGIRIDGDQPRINMLARYVNDPVRGLFLFSDIEDLTILEEQMAVKDHLPVSKMEGAATQSDRSGIGGCRWFLGKTR